jgi:hypothetical protein
MQQRVLSFFKLLGEISPAAYRRPSGSLQDRSGQLAQTYDVELFGVMSGV